MDLHTLQAALARLAESGPDERCDHPRGLAIALGAQAGAVLDPFRWLDDAEADALDDAARASVARDAIEAMLYALRLATRMGVNVDAAVAERLAARAGGGQDAASEAVPHVSPDEAAPEPPSVAAANDGDAYDATVRLPAFRPEGASSEPGAARPEPAPAEHETHTRSSAPAEVADADPRREDGPDPAGPPEAGSPPASTPLPAPSRMVEAASAAFARAQAAAARVSRTFVPAEPSAAPADEPPEEDEFDSTITLDAGPAPNASARTTTPGPAPATTPGSARATTPHAPAGAGDARHEEAAGGAATSHAQPQPEEHGAEAAAAPVGRHPPDRHGRETTVNDAAPNGDHARHRESHGRAAHKHAESGAHRGGGSEDTGSHGGRRGTAARHGDKGGATGSHSGGGTHHGKAHGRTHGDGHADKRHGEGRQDHGSARPHADSGEHRRAERHGHGGEGRADRAADHGRNAHEPHPQRDAAREHPPAGRARPAPERYAKLDFAAVQSLRKSMAGMLEGIHRKDPLLRELAEELETLRRTLYSNAAKPAWIADTLLTLRRMLEESVGEGLGNVLDAERRIAAIDALLE